MQRICSAASLFGSDLGCSAVALENAFWCWCRKILDGLSLVLQADVGVPHGHLDIGMAGHLLRLWQRRP